MPKPKPPKDEPDEELERLPTRQENDLYAALMAGDADKLGELHDDAYDAVQELDEETGLTQAAQFDVDYGYAFGRYQDDNEMPEAERETNTAAHAGRENEAAPEADPVEPAPELQAQPPITADPIEELGGGESKMTKPAE